MLSSFMHGTIYLTKYIQILVLGLGVGDNRSCASVSRSGKIYADMGQILNLRPGPGDMFCFWEEGGSSLVYYEQEYRLLLL